ncbi:ABC transporter ATP-binding protein [Candidatus Enterococcus ikei]|uniref:ABC transporter ATP-binding protein n=1 Tax=Candidatus Enterococcus ikei TaxID=2815326 RepID=A0ABS3H408_9ENTE|nr:ABC transporter ATP-binding protein [Enterococcus sp. DIV0869a]MBO0441741.1 ABC transporter ATP-binding protein [Enterococcus sp. DIV0869a]
MGGILEIKGVTKYSGKQRMFEKLDFSLDEPKIIALVAPNGTGKTTLLNIIANIDSVDEGSIAVFGKTHTDSQMFHNVSYLQDSSILYDYLTGWEHLEFVRNVYGKTKEEIQAIIEELDIAVYLNKKVKTYSLEMKQYLLLAISLINEPKLLLMDEPLNGLDPISSIKVKNCIRSLAKQGVSVILTSCNLYDLATITEDIFFLYEGKLVEKEEAIIDVVEYMVVLEEVDKALSFLSRIDVSCTQISKYKLRGNFTKHQLTVFRSFCKEQEITLFDFQVTNGHLERVYFNLYGKMNEP